MCSKTWCVDAAVACLKSLFTSFARPHDIAAANCSNVSDMYAHFADVHEQVACPLLLLLLLLLVVVVVVAVVAVVPLTNFDTTTAMNSNSNNKSPWPSLYSMHQQGRCTCTPCLVGFRPSTPAAHRHFQLLSLCPLHLLPAHCPCRKTASRCTCTTWAPSACSRCAWMAHPTNPAGA